MGAGDRSPLVFAHRGSSEALPEHTLAAYLRALEEGADGLECDVRLTRDGHLVCVHDSRLNRTSNGRGRVSAYTLAELEVLDFGSWHPAAAAVQGGGNPGGIGAAVDVTEPPADATAPGIAAAVAQENDADAPVAELTRLLTLSRLLDAVRASGRAVRLLVETKHPSRYGAEVERRLVDLLRQYDLAEPIPGDPVSVTVMSFAALAVRRIGRLAPRLPTVYLLEVLPPGVGRGRLPFGATIAAPGIGLVKARPGLLPALRAAGHQAYVWTVNEEPDLELVLEQGVDGVITDRPRFVLDRLGR